MKLAMSATISSIALILVTTATVSAQSVPAEGSSVAVSGSTDAAAPSPVAADPAPSARVADASPVPVMAPVSHVSRPAVIPQPVPRPFIALRNRREATPLQQEARLRAYAVPDRIVEIERPVVRSFPIVTGIGF